MDEQAKKLKREYNRIWQRKNKDKVRQYQEKYWLKKARERAAQEQEQERAK